MHRSLAVEIGLPGDQIAEKAIKHHLDICVKEAGTAIDGAFAMSRTELTEENFPLLENKKCRSSRSLALRQVSEETTSSSTQRTVSTSSELSQESTITGASSLSGSGLDEHDKFKLDASANNFAAGKEGYHSYFTKDSMESEQEAAAKGILVAASETSGDDRDSTSSGCGVKHSLEQLFHENPRWLELAVNISESWVLTEEATLLSTTFLAELDEPSDTRWKAELNEYHRCCGEKKASNPR